MKLLTQIIAFVEVLHVPATATSEEIFRGQLPWVTPDFTAALEDLKKIDGVRKVEFVDTDVNPDPNRAGVEYELRLTVNARTFVGPEAWAQVRQEYRDEGEPMDAVTIVGDHIGCSAFPDELLGRITPHLGQDYDVTVSDSFDVEEAA